MQILAFDRQHAQPIDNFNSRLAAGVHLGDGLGEAHVYCIYLEAGGEIGVHRAGFGQLFLLIQGSAWAAGEDGQRVQLATGQAAYFSAGEIHSKGSDTGGTALMIQVSQLSAATHEQRRNAETR